MKRITMQELAEACGLSRNTVSKVFNGRGSVPESTINLVMRKAQELGYFGVSLPETPKKPEANDLSIALFTGHMPKLQHFGTSFIPIFANQLSLAGYTMTIFEVSEEEIQSNRYPSGFSPEKTAGILCIELFDPDYCDMICTCDIPVLMIDGYMQIELTPPKADILSMENVSCTAAITKQAIRLGAKSIGFVGDPEHCNSFYERWLGLKLALQDYEMIVNREFCILEKDGPCYADSDWMLKQLDKMTALPDAFICANDFIASYLMSSLQKKGLRIPEDIFVSGFDCVSIPGAVGTSLTTARIPSEEMAKTAAEMLLARIREPYRPYRFTYLYTDVVWGETLPR